MSQQVVIQKDAPAQTWGWGDRPSVLRWLRGPTIEPTFGHPDRYSIWGSTGSGKSSLLTAIAAAHFTKPGSQISILDSYASLDAESLAWFMSPFADRCTLIVGDGVDVKFNKAKYDVLKASDWTIKMLDDHRIFIIVKAAFAPAEIESDILYFKFLDHVAKLCERRDEYRLGWADILVMREAGQFLSSRAMLRGNITAKDAQSELVNMSETTFHHNIALVYDRPRRVSLSKDIREVVTWEAIKATGIQDFREVKFVLAFVDVDFLRRMPKNMSLIMGENGSISIWRYDFPFWLKYAKCVAEDEVIYTPNGIVKAKELHDGDQILGGKILNLHNFEDELYEITINRNTKFRANGEHPIFIRKRNSSAGHTAGNPQWATLKEIYENRPNGGTGWHVKMVSPTQFSFNTISVGTKFAKLLGYLMSDGYFSDDKQVKFTNKSEKLLSEVTKLGEEIGQELGFGVKRHRNGNGYDLSLTGNVGVQNSPLKDKLRELGVIDRTTFGKVQMLEDEELKEFIKGYFNGDGSLSEEHPICFAIGLHKRQADELQFMLWRLDIMSTVAPLRMKKNTNICWLVNVNDGESKLKLLDILEDTKYPDKFSRFRQSVNASAWRKVKRQKDGEGSWFHITGIKKVGRGNVIGWTVDPSNLIIGRMGLKTHNSGVPLWKTTGIELSYDVDLIKKLTDKASPQGQNGPRRQFSQQHHEELVKRMAGGETMRDIAIKGFGDGASFSLTTIKNQARMHQLKQCDCVDND